MISKAGESAWEGVPQVYTVITCFIDLSRVLHEGRDLGVNEGSKWVRTRSLWLSLPGKYVRIKLLVGSLNNDAAAITVRKRW